MRLTRISITIPQSLVRETAQRAKSLDRSRSWVVVDALRRYLAEPEARGGGASRLTEPSEDPFAVGRSPGLGPSRRAQLAADLQLTPEARVKEAEHTARVAELRRPRGRVDRVLTFDRYQDYLVWDRWENVRP